MEEIKHFKDLPDFICLNREEILYQICLTMDETLINKHVFGYNQYHMLSIFIKQRNFVVVNFLYKIGFPLVSIEILKCISDNNEVGLYFVLKHGVIPNTNDVRTFYLNRFWDNKIEMFKYLISFHPNPIELKGLNLEKKYTDILEELLSQV